MKRSLKYIVLLVLCYACADGQEEQLVIGRTTGELHLEGQVFTTFGFTNTLSGQVTLPGTTIVATAGDTVVVDFWNISQGEPHALFADSLELISESEVMSVESIKEVHHMDHAFYHIVADKPGYHLYYCPFNFPFNVQAGMFGLVHVQASSRADQPMPEMILCSHEIDTTWHREEIMDIDKDGITLLLENYKPQHFLVNGKPMHEFANEGIQRNEPMKLHFLNAGQYQHEIKVLSTSRQKASSQSATPNANHTIILRPMASKSIDIVLADKEALSIQYDFRNIETKRIEHSEILNLK